MGSNVHGLNEFSSTGDRAYESNVYWGPSRYGSNAAMLPNPNDLRCIDLFFPGFRWKSFVVWISFLQAAVYIASLFMGSHDLEPSGNALSTLGSSYGPSIQKGEVYRLVMPMFLHASVWHILFNVFFQIRMGLGIEETYGLRQTALLYFASGIAGNLFSVAIAPCKSAVGASTAGFGLIGAQMAEMALAWNRISNRDQAIFNIIVFFVISIMLSVAPSSFVDWRGHAGGFLAGFAIMLLYNRRRENRPRWIEKAGSYVATGTLLGLYVACTLVIFLIPMRGERGRCS